MNDLLLKKLFEDHNKSDKEKIKKNIEQQIDNLIQQNKKIKLRLDFTTELNSADLLIKLENNLDCDFSLLFEFLIKFLFKNMNKEVFIKLSKHFNDEEKLFDLICQENKLIYLKYILEEPFFNKNLLIKTIINHFYLNNDITKFFIIYFYQQKTSENINYEVLEKLLPLKFHKDIIEIILQKEFKNFIRNDQIIQKYINNEIVNLLLLYIKPSLSEFSINHKLLYPYVIKKKILLQEMFNDDIVTFLINNF